MPADVQERAELAVTAAHDDDVFPTHVDGPAAAIEFGLDKTARVITGAAAIMMAVFIAFGTASIAVSHSGSV